MPDKADKIESLEREDQVFSWMCRGWRSPKIVENAIQKWNIERAQAYRYIRKARERLEKMYEQKQAQGLSEMLGRHHDMRDKGYEVGDFRFVLDLDKEDAKLLGLYPSEKHEHDIPALDRAIELELARLAGISEEDATSGTEATE